ncbi:protein spaetzle 4-like [Stegodyphus dumicola]|uniref:protein spaetzle 4-like n=1 Tax=Stegodyphus dumicola TaxID=202533 RepID=UPI0015AE2F7D|nr:protein spaetzle 4-like [Stegodyphus dumicola]
MDSTNFFSILIHLAWILAVTVMMLLEKTNGQSCGPRVSARLLAEIPCDMSKTGYCSAPGSAYPWSSVKRYINDNQGLVRRMYGDERHSSVLMHEIDGFRMKFDMLQAAFNAPYSRTEYGRSARSRQRPTRRQPRPQIFPDDPEEEEDLNPSNSREPATIFRVVTETSIKVGEAITQAMKAEEQRMTSQETVVSYEPASEFETPTTDSISSTTQTATTMTDGTTTTATTTTESTFETRFSTETPTTAENSTTTPFVDVSEKVSEPDNPVAMERIGYPDYGEDYGFEPRRKLDSAVLENSVEEKIVDKDESGISNAKRTDTSKLSNDAKIDGDLVIDSTEEEESREENEADLEEEEEKEEEVPRRGINACPVKNEVIAPYWANNTRGETLALLNVHPFEQYVHFEKCAFENHQMLCREGCRCEQQYRLHRLLAFDPKNECRGIFSDWFRFPSCCVCICYDLTPDIPRTRSRKGRMK